MENIPAAKRLEILKNRSDASFSPYSCVVHLTITRKKESERKRGKVRFDLHTPEHQFPCIFNEGSRPPSGHTYRRCTGAGIRGQTRISHGLLVPPRTAARLRIEVAIHTVESPPRIVRESGSDFSHQACYIPFPSLSKGGEVRIFSPFSPPPSQRERRN